ncbi:serine hydrolase domain-containing protein [Marinobacter sp.]|uniref:serine hydrolase domain-containing protein n=1 Tax=Marinobacter sp. TaxID=50741 RepID=UPI0035655E89
MSILKKSRLKDLLLVIVMVALVAGVAHFVITNPLGSSRLLYYIQVPVTQWNTRCSESAPKWMAEIQRYASRNMAAPTSQLAYVSPEGELHHCETGWKDGIFGDTPLTADTRFRYASTTKTVTAAAVLDLINQGKLTLGEAIIDVLELEGELSDPRIADITIEHLLSHRAGWDRERTQDVMFLMNRKPWCPDNPQKLRQSGLMYDPGETELYSNLGYCLLGLAIEKVSGQPYREFMASHFDFDSSTLEFIDGPFRPDEVEYDFRFENFYTDTYHEKFNFQALSSSAGLSGSASDLARLVSNALDSRPLTILDGDMESGCDPGDTQSCYGYGVYRYQPEGAEIPLYIHGGKLPGNPSAIVVDPAGGVLVWLGAGGPRPNGNATRGFYDYLRGMLANHYQHQ